MTNAEKILTFLFELTLPVKLTGNIEVMNPFTESETRRVATIFYNRFYADQKPRYCIIGINPGRFGAGVTGVPFTDPIRLEKELGISNAWPAKQELSSVFVYETINAFGGPDKFYNKFYITAVSPLGFTKNNKNLNYYDDKVLTEAIKPFAVDCFRKQLSWGLQTSVAFCLGEGANFKFMRKLNEAYNFFEKITPLSHPRFIMQYQLKQKEAHINKYLEQFNRVPL